MLLLSGEPDYQKYISSIAQRKKGHARDHLFRYKITVPKQSCVIDTREDGK